MAPRQRLPGWLARSPMAPRQRLPGWLARSPMAPRQRLPGWLAHECRGERGAGHTAVPGDSIMEVDGLFKHFPIRSGFFQRQVGAVKAVDGVSFDVRRGETLGLV